MIAESVQQVLVQSKAGPSCPRILFVIPGVDSGSSMVFARRQAETLRTMGVPVDVFYLKSRTSPIVLFREFLRFRRTLAESLPDVVHAHFGTVTAMFVALSPSRIPMVVTYRGSDLNASLTSRGMRALVGRVVSQFAALRASRIVCVSRQLRERLWWRRSRVSVLPSGVDTCAFHPMNRNAARNALGWAIDQRIVLFNAGHDPRNKRLDLARAAAAITAQRLGSLRLEVLDGSMEPDRMPFVINASDCLLVTSDSEGSPTIVQEALACNLPIVSVDAGDIRERLAGVEGTRIADRDPHKLAEALVELIEFPLRSDGREHVDEFCSHRIATELLRIYTATAMRNKTVH